MKNPFRGLSEIQHCRGDYWDGKGSKCAAAVMINALWVTPETYQKFKDFLINKCGAPIWTLNDSHLKSFAWFAERWDEFVAAAPQSREVL